VKLPHSSPSGLRYWVFYLHTQCVCAGGSVHELVFSLTLLHTICS
jgi:hypothetical protein